MSAQQPIHTRNLLLLCILVGSTSFAQVSHHSIYFFGSGVGPPPGQNRIKFRIDNPSTVLDVGGDFTIDFWMRCPSGANFGTVSEDPVQGIGWITGNVIVDRDIFGTADRGKYGLSIGQAGASRVLCFGVTTNNSGLSIVGTNNVAGPVWRHVAITRVSTNGLMRIYVDGRLDASGFGPVGDISYADNRPTSYPNSDPFLVLAAEKHDAGSAFPSYNGYLDEFRVWTQALSQAQISNVYRVVIATNTPGLIAYYRFEEGGGTNITDSTGRSPTGTLFADAISNGQWFARSSDTNWTAPVGPPTPPPPSTNVTILSLPPGLSVSLDGVAEATPFTRVLPITNLVTLAAPTNQSLNGTAYVFRCWSDGGAQNRSLLVPTTGLTLRAGYAAVPGGALEQPVPANNRNIESYAGTNTFANVFVANCLCAGRDNSPPLRYEPAMAFPLAVTPGAVIQSATLRVRGNSDNSGAPQLTVRAFAVSNLAAFTAGAGASVTGLHPLTSATIAWTPPAFSSGISYDSPDLAPLVQEVVNLAGWSAGNFIGLVLTATNGSGDHWRCWSNFQSGTPPRLLVTYTTGGIATNDLDGDGLPDDWEAQHGFDCTTAAAADADTDGDGVSDRAEFIALTSPTNAAHFQRLEILPASVSNVWKISFATATGRLYRIDAATNLLAPEWVPVATAWTGTGATADFTDTNDAPARYFRTGVEFSP